MSRVDDVVAAIDLIKLRIQSIPNFDLYGNILRQLEYLHSVLTEENADKSNLDKIIVGHYAVHEFEESDPELAKLLRKYQKIVFDMT